MSKGQVDCPFISSQSPLLDIPVILANCLIVTHCIAFIFLIILSLYQIKLLFSYNLSIRL